MVARTSVSSRVTAHGRRYEPVAVETFKKTTGLVVSRFHLSVSQHQPYLAASPDRLVDDDTVLEGKCPLTSRNQAISPATAPYLRKVDNELILDRNHNYYYQVLGQLFCAEKMCCFFCIFTLADFVEIKFNGMMSSLHTWWSGSVNFSQSILDRQFLKKIYVHIFIDIMFINSTSQLVIVILNMTRGATVSLLWLLFFLHMTFVYLCYK